MKKQEQLLANLLEEFKKVQAQHNLPFGDFPHLGKFREKLKNLPLHKFPPLKPETIKLLDEVIERDIPRLMQMLPKGDEVRLNKEGRIESSDVESNPFAQDPTKAKIGHNWVVNGE